MEYRRTLRLQSTGLFGLAGGGIVVRSFQDGLSTAFEVAVPGTVVMAASALGLDAIGWVLGWLFLGALVYGASASTYSAASSGFSSLRHRWLLPLGTAILAAALGMAVQQRILVESFGYGDVPLPVAEYVPGLVGTGAAAYAGCAGALYLANGSAIDGASGLLWRGSAFGVLAAPLLTLAELLYPLLEVTVVVWTLTAVAVARAPVDLEPAAAVEDPIRRVTVAATAAWAGGRGFVAYFYVVVGLVLSFGMVFVSGETLPGLAVVLVRSSAENPVGAAFVAVCAGGSVIYGTWYWYRVVERLPFTLVPATVVNEADAPSEGRSNGVRPNAARGPLGRTDGDEERTAPASSRPAAPDDRDPFRFRARPPGLCAPVALFFGLVNLNDAVRGGGTLVSMVDSVPPRYLVFALVVAGGAIATVVRTKRADPDDPLVPDRLAIPAAVGLVFFAVMVPRGPAARTIDGLLMGAGFEGSAAGVLLVLVQTVVITASALLPYAIPRLLETDRWGTRLIGYGQIVVVAGFLILLFGGSADVETAAKALGTVLLLALAGIVVEAVTAVGSLSRGE